MDPRNRVITGFSSLYITLSTKNRPPYFFGGLFFIISSLFFCTKRAFSFCFMICAHITYLFSRISTNAYSRSKYVCSSLSAVISQSGSSSRFGKYASASYAKSIFCHMSCITVREHLFVNTVSADTVHILCRIFLHFLQCFLDAVNDHRTFYLIIPVAGDHNVGSVFQRKSVWKDSSVFLPITTTFPVVSSRNIFISAGILTKVHYFFRFPSFYLLQQ